MIDDSGDIHFPLEYRLPQQGYATTDWGDCVACGEREVMCLSVGTGITEPFTICEKCATRMFDKGWQAYKESPCYDPNIKRPVVQQQRSRHENRGIGPY